MKLNKINLELEPSFKEVLNFFLRKVDAILKVLEDFKKIGMCGSKKNPTETIQSLSAQMELYEQILPRLFKLKPSQEKVKLIKKGGAMPRIEIPAPNPIDANEIFKLINKQFKNHFKPNFKEKIMLKEVVVEKIVEKTKEIQVEKFKDRIIEKPSEHKPPSHLVQAMGALFGYGSARNYQKAYELLKQAVNEGDFEAAAYLGWMHLEGIGRPINLKKAEKYYKIAADNKVAEGFYQLARMLENKLLAEGKDIGGAISYYKKAAELNHTEALTDMGYFYENGKIGNGVDDKKAEEFYQQAIKANNSRAMCNLGMIYYRFYMKKLNTSGSKDESTKRKALNLFEMALKLGNPKAYALLGKYYDEEGNEPKAKEYFTQGRALNDPECKFYCAFYQLMDLLRENSDDMSAYERVAETFHQVLIEVPDYYLASYYLGFLYEVGYGVPQNIPIAENYFIKAEKDSNGLHTNTLIKRGAVMFSKNNNPEEALKYLTKAAEQNDPLAMNEVGLLLREGVGAAKDEGKAEQYFMKSHLLNFEEGSMNYALLLMKSEEQDKTKEKNGYRILTDLASKGSEVSRILLTNQRLATSEQNYFEEEPKHEVFRSEFE